MSKCATQSVLFPELLEKPLKLAFDEPATTSDGGAALLRVADEMLGLTARMSSVVTERREGSKVVFDLLDLIRQRVYGIACGYADCNDAARAGRDPMHLLLADREPLGGGALASQPTLSRFENGVGPKDLLRMGSELADVVISRQRRRLRRRRVRLITIDLDPTEDRTHGAQQLSLFNGHYGSWCYLPLLGFVTFNDEPEQYLVAAILRSGRSKASLGALGLLRRLIPRLRAAFPEARIRVRLDGGFAGPEMLDFLEDEQRVEYLIAIGRNSVLREIVEPLMAKMRSASDESGKSEATFGETKYAAKSWKKRARRVIMKAEVVRLAERDPRDNSRFVVTNLSYVPRTVYKIYRGRGDSENRIKELKNDLEIDRTSCSRFWANQLRVLLTAAAYALYQELRSRLSRYTDKRPSVAQLRLRFIKIGGRLESSVRRFVLHLADSHPWQRRYVQLARSLGAT